MSSGPAGSSSQALEAYINEQLAQLSLTVPQDDVEFIARFVEEEGMEREDKVEGVKGMLEGVVEGGVLPDEGVDEALDRVINEWDRLLAEEKERQEAEESDDSPPPQPVLSTKNILDTLSPEELETAKRRALLKQYAYVEGDEEELASLNRDRNAPPRAMTAAEAEEKKKADERRRMIEEALRLDGRKKKFKKQADVDLLAPNLNAEKVAYKQKMEREAAKKASTDKKERDRAALEKQKADIAKAKADKQKKAAKQERRA